MDTNQSPYQSPQAVLLPESKSEFEPSDPWTLLRFLFPVFPIAIAVGWRLGGGTAENWHSLLSRLAAVERIPSAYVAILIVLLAGFSFGLRFLANGKWLAGTIAVVVTTLAAGMTTFAVASGFAKI